MTKIDEPYGIILELKTMPDFSSRIFISQVLDITKSTDLPSLSFDLTTLRSSISVTPSNLAINSFSSEILPAIPPTWNVLNVS